MFVIKPGDISLFFSTSVILLSFHSDLLSDFFAKVSSKFLLHYA